ncbi:MAG: PPC domain-containing DNA-binding protein [Halodesulfurarchaeum sp.]
MHATAVSPDRTLLVSLEYDEPLKVALQTALEETGLATAWLIGHGALREATLATYDQDHLEAVPIDLDEPLEMPLLLGSVGKHTNLHATLARASGQSLAGRLEAATVFGGEALLWGFAESLDREPDPATGLPSLRS